MITREIRRVAELIHDAMDADDLFARTTDLHPDQEGQP